ncbi:phage tail tape measure protein [Dehalococcoides mccartyi]|uniref:phage tail tape measure protein n=1 Tax=Dehalococcoides mccartyi TaxID=61435 RepID=UPI0002B767F9|nr:phage tail tape measure protein [Dehalococcoides mccartyi]AGG07983.1 putative phage tail tape measure protein [Dehalococcoides mccartyi BTF08]AQU05966.1 phage tail tape measure protein [Dehalococcoides mccartyi]AQU07411.1 phage tail tape measure protein [Dehalococcoides mccartyi]AQW62514.1 phage tail tape measure protein [Dehalococcoides mccartyi]
MEIFSLVGKMALEGQAQVEEGLKKTKEQTKQVQDALKLLGAAFTAVGAAGIAMVSSARKLNAELGQTAITLGVSTQDMRDLALETTNVTFGLESVVATFGLLVRAGVNNTEQLQANANAFDALADATGSSAEAVAGILIPAMKNLGEQLPENSTDMDKYTWLTKNTTIVLEDFGSVMNYVAAYGSNLNLTAQELIATLAALEDKGISGSAATRLLRTAITQADESGVSLNKILGITQAEIDAYTAKMSAATGITDEYAEVANSQYGIMDKVKQKISEVALSWGSWLTPLEPIISLVSALGPALIFLASAQAKATFQTISATAASIAQKTATIAQTVATKAQTAAQWAANAAQNANPIGLIITAVAALTAGIVLLVKNWEKVTGFFKGLFGGAKDDSSAVDELTQKIATLTQEQDKAKAKLSEMEKALKDAKSTSFGYSDALDEANANLKSHKNALADAEEELQRVQAEYDDAKEVVADFEQQISDANRELDKLSSPNLVGMQKYEDQIFSVEQQIKKLELAQLQEGESEGRKQQIEDLRNQLQVLELQRDIEFDPLIRSAKESVETIQGLNDEMAPADVMARISELGQEISPDGVLGKGLSEAQAILEDKNNALMAQTGIVSGLKDEIAGYEAEIENINDAIETISSQWDRAIAAQKAAVESLGNTIDDTKAKLDYLQTGKWSGDEINMPGTIISGDQRRTDLNKDNYTEHKSFDKGYYYVPRFANGGDIPEPTLLYGLKSMRPYALAGEAGPEKVIPAGKTADKTVINNYVNINNPIVRQETDIKRITQQVSEEMQRLYQRNLRQAGA